MLYKYFVFTGVSSNLTDLTNFHAIHAIHSFKWVKKKPEKPGDQRVNMDLRQCGL